MPPLAAAGLALGRWHSNRGTEPRRAPAVSPCSALAARAQAGDDEAFDDLMRETEPRVLAIGWRLLGTRDLARDAAQETFLRAYRYLARFRPDRDFEAWICRITVNVCRDLHRRSRSGAPSLPVSWETEREAGRVPEPSAAASSEAALLETERTRLVLDAIAQLPPREKAALVLRDIEGMTSERAAQILGSTAGTIRSQVATARVKLRRALEAKLGARR
ncbi:MAG TPA: sigma-70 family RNA polymerase sigma factor [Thermoanaerobaculia bacterium]|nr:sigma-70 family RNA polymerase sigma factor [Thermoanaerobaculia bacterium]